MCQAIMGTCNRGLTWGRGGGENGGYGDFVFFVGNDFT